MKSEWVSGKNDRKGKRRYLSEGKTREMLKQLNHYLEGMVAVSRIRITDYNDALSRIRAPTRDFVESTF